MTAEEFINECRSFIAIKAKNFKETQDVLKNKFSRVELDEEENIRIYDATTPEEVVKYLYNKNIIISEIKIDKVRLEEYYIDLMEEGKK